MHPGVREPPPLYDWFIDELGIYHPQKIEFTRLNLTYTVMSKRKFLELVQAKLVSGWDDPRMPTISGMKRRGYSPASIREFAARIGVAKINSTIALETLEHAVREDLNRISPGYMGVLDPLKVKIENLEGEDVTEVINNPQDPSADTRKVPFSGEVYIEREDFMEAPVPKFFRLAPWREVRLRNAYLITCTGVEKDGSEVTSVVCKVDPASRGGDGPDKQKIKSTLHWVSARHAIPAEIKLYDKLFTAEDPMSLPGDFKQYVNPNSLKVVKGSKVEPKVRELSCLDRFQFERLGYFCMDPDTTNDCLVLNRTITLRDNWAKEKQKA